MHTYPQRHKFGRKAVIAVALLCGCIVQVGCSHTDVEELRVDAKGVEVVGKTVEEMDKQFGAGKSIDFDSLPPPFKLAVSTKDGTFRQWSKKDGTTSTTVYAEIKDGKTGPTYIEQQAGGGSIKMTVQQSSTPSK